MTFNTPSKQIFTMNICMSEDKMRKIVHDHLAKWSGVKDRVIASYKVGDLVEVTRDFTDAYIDDAVTGFSRCLQKGDRVMVSEVDNDEGFIWYEVNSSWNSSYGPIKYGLPIDSIILVKEDLSSTLCKCDTFTVLMVTGCQCEAGKRQLAEERKKC